MRLVQFTTDDDLRLNGLLNDVGSDVTIIHVHGKGGNFYENKFLKIMMDRYAQAHINLLSFNNRGHSIYVEAHKGDGLTYIGTAVEEFTDCLLDLDAAVRFAGDTAERIVLQGHSFGCEKVMYYGQKRSDGLDLILLSPSDGYKLQEVWIQPETVEHQIERLLSSHDLEGMEWLPQSEYGISVEGSHYHVPITAKALLGLLRGPAFKLIRLDRPWNEPLIPNRALVYLGGRDGMQLDGLGAMEAAMHDRFENVTMRVYHDGDHHLRPVCDAVISDIVSWLSDS